VANPDDIDDLTYEQARDELISIVAKLEAGSVSLEDSLALWERGEALAVRCQALLEGARVRIDKVRGEAAEPAEEGTE
jgi:exodeoxyribonuclease VII small subunit